MEFLTFALDRVSQAVGLSSPSQIEDRVERLDRVEGSISLHDIFHIAFLLHHKLPADLVPAILEYAEVWKAIRIASRQSYQRIENGQALYAGGVVPLNIPQGTIRVIRFKTISRDQGWSSYPENHNTYDNSWTWFEAGVTGLDDDVVPFQCGHDWYENDHLSACPLDYGPYKYGSQRIVTNLHAHREDKEHIVEWRADDENVNVRETLKEVKSGCGIEVTAAAQFGGWCNHVKSVVIEIEYAPVRRL